MVLHISIGGGTAAALALAAGIGMSPAAKADEAYAKNMLKTMSDYMTKQTAMSFGYDAGLEIVTVDHQKLQQTAG